jgi:hypothetical protein
MQDHGLVAKFDQRFRESKRLYTHQSRVPSYKNSRSANGFRWGAEVQRTSGRRRVPKPPTRMRAASLIRTYPKLSASYAQLTLHVERM